MAVLLTRAFCVVLAVLVLCVQHQCVCADVIPLTSWLLSNDTKGGWYNVTVPATVFAGLLQNGLYPDVFYGHTLQNISTDPFSTSWWYSTSFSLPSSSQGKHVVLTFKGLNYAANVWVNGEQLGTSSEIAGAFRYFDFDVTNIVKFGGSNAIEVEVFPPHDRVFPPNNNDTDLSITFVDWSPPPPDNSMGLWREVEISVTGPVSIKYPQVATVLTSLDLAHLTIMTELSNLASTSISGTVQVNIPGVGSFAQNVTLAANDITKVFFTNNSFAELNVASPDLWWPWQMGAQNLYTLSMSFSIDGQISDSLNASFGIRQTTSELDKNGHRLYRVNGNPILIRGAGWAPDMFLRSTPQRQEYEFTYVRDMGLNAIRLEGKMENDNFFDLADRYGILIMPGWCCCDAWQHWDAWGPAQYTIAKESLESQIKRLRIHPSILVFMYSSDELPPVTVEKLYLSVFADEFWPNPIIASAADTTSTLTGPSGVKMSGPYSWVPPNYWLLDTSQLGGAFGFLTEGGPGEAPMTLESWLWTVPNTSLWPMNSDWDFHCGNPQGVFRNLRFFNPPLYARYGVPTSASDFMQKSQASIYESHRAMFEGYSRNKYTSTGVIQWMLNNPWPEMIWHLYDYYLNVGGSYFGTKKACEDLHIQYSYDDNSVWIVNSLYHGFANLEASVKVLSIDAVVLFNQSISVAQIGPDAAVSVLTIPSSIKGLSSTYFVQLLLESNGQTVSENFYWLSTAQDVLAWNESNFYRTPCSSYANYSLLETLPRVDLNVSYQKSVDSQDIVWLSINVTNPTNAIAFFVRLRVLKGEGGSDILPILWDDNYVSILPYATKQMQARFELAQLGDSVPVLVVETYNNISGK